MSIRRKGPSPARKPISICAPVFQSGGGKHADILAPEAVEAYFSELYGFADLDAKHLLKTLREKNRRFAVPHIFDFRTMDALYQLIPEDTAPS